MKRYKIRNIKDKEDFYYISEVFAKIFENSQIKNNQSFIRIKTLQDKEINILPAEWRIKEDGETEIVKDYKMKIRVYYRNGKITDFDIPETFKEEKIFFANLKKMKENKDIKNWYEVAIIT